jgi:hypothetical protein
MSDSTCSCTPSLLHKVRLRLRTRFRWRPSCS